MSLNSISLVSLLNDINQLSGQLTSYLQANNLQPPTFSASSPSDYPPDASLSLTRMKLSEKLTDMALLVQGPAEHMFIAPISGQCDLLTQHFICYFNIINLIPLDGSMSFADIALKVNLPQSLIRRILRHAFTMRMFQETRPGSDLVAHTSFSAFVRNNYANFQAWLDHHVENSAAGVRVFSKTHELYSKGQLEPPTEAGRSAIARALWNPNDDPKLKDFSLFDWFKSPLGGNPPGWQVERFGKAMKLLHEASYSKHLEALLEGGFDWKSLGQATVVDVGGSLGHLSHLICDMYPNLKCIVQDLPELETPFNNNLPPNLHGRVSFKAGNFFEPETIIGDVYLFKLILHDWSDENCKIILQNLLPAMKPGSYIINIDAVVPPPANEANEKAVPLPAEKYALSFDLAMMLTLNSKERTELEWRSLFQSASPKFIVEKVYTSPHTSLGMIVVKYQD